MKAVIAIDSLKGSLTSLQAGDAIREGILRAYRDASVLVRPLADTAKKYGKPVIAFSGAVTQDAVLCNEHGIDAFFPIVRGVSTLDDAMNSENAHRNMADTAEQVFRLIKTIRGE